MSGWTVKVRAGSRVDRARHDDLRGALATLEERGRELERDAGAKPRSPLGRTYEPVQQVVARLELSGPGRLRAGIDVRGDGSSEAFTGRFRRQLVNEHPGESAYDALRRELSSR